MRHTRIQTKNLVISALCLAMAYVLPFLTGQIPEIGAMLCPLHIPVLLCGFLCGWPWGLAVGFVAPLLRSLTLGMPPFFPTAFCMAFELATYGLVSGMLRARLPHKPQHLYLSLVAAMVSGRLVWGAVMFLCLGAEGFPFSAFLSGAVLGAIPGIILQILLIPLLVVSAERFLHAGKSHQIQ